MNRNKCKKRNHKRPPCRHDVKDMGFVLLVFGVVTICAFFLPVKAWILLLGCLLLICGIRLYCKWKDPPLAAGLAFFIKWHGLLCLTGCIWYKLWLFLLFRFLQSGSSECSRSIFFLCVCWNETHYFRKPGLCHKFHIFLTSTAHPLSILSFRMITNWSESTRTNDIISYRKPLYKFFFRLTSAFFFFFLPQNQPSFLSGGVQIDNPLVSAAPER